MYVFYLYMVKTLTLRLCRLYGVEEDIFMGYASLLDNLTDAKPVWKLWLNLKFATIVWTIAHFVIVVLSLAWWKHI